MEKLFALVDCNNFYASCERVFAPKLQHKPIVVLSNNDGCIIARSNEAKELGFKMGEPEFLVKEKLAQHHVQVFSSNYTLYGDMSARVMQTLAHFSPHLEVYSIDEAFLDLSHLPQHAVAEHAQKLRETVRQWTGIPVSVGVAPTKTLAKLANRLSKKQASTNGVLLLHTPQHIAQALQRTAVGDVWGIGSRNAAKLAAHGIHTAFGLAQASDAFVRKHLTVVGLRTAKELRGEPCLELEQAPANKQHICTSRSFGSPDTDIELVREATALYASRCAAKLRNQKSCARTITVFVQAFPHIGGYYNSKTLLLPVATNGTLELIHYAHLALQPLLREAQRYKKTGVIVSELCPQEQAQLPLIDVLDREKHQRLMQVMDTINTKWGRETVVSAAQGVYDESTYKNMQSRKRSNPWGMRKEYKSNRYTTHWEELLCVQA